MEEPRGIFSGFRVNMFGELESRAFVVEPEDIEGTTVRGWLMLATGTTHSLVILEAEDRDSRNRRALLPDLARGMGEILMTLSRLRSASPKPTASSNHPGWCSLQEATGEPHRSRELHASVPRSDGTASARLVHGRHHGASLPCTFIDLHDGDQSLGWPPITPRQHDALIFNLAALLDQQHSMAAIAA
jgi:hypothetical protein